MSKRLLPFLNFIDNRLASPLDSRFKDKLIKDGAQKKAMRLLQVHITSRLGQYEKDSSSNSTDDENEIIAKKP